MNKLSFAARCLLLCIGPACCAAALADPIDVHVTTTGKPGNWKLRFQVAKDPAQFPADAGIHVFAVQLPNDSEIEEPPGFGIEYNQDWKLQDAGGSATPYNKAWVAHAGRPGPHGGVYSFKAVSRAEHAPSSVPWFVWAKAESNNGYVGNGPFFGSRAEPHFEGLALATSVPEPATCGLFGLGLACVAAARKWSLSGGGSALHPD